MRKAKRCERLVLNGLLQRNRFYNFADFACRYRSIERGLAGRLSFSMPASESLPSRELMSEGLLVSEEGDKSDRAEGEDHQWPKALWGREEPAAPMELQAIRITRRFVCDDDTVERKGPPNRLPLATRAAHWHLKGGTSAGRPRRRPSRD